MGRGGNHGGVKPHLPPESKRRPWTFMALPEILDLKLPRLQALLGARSLSRTVEIAIDRTLVLEESRRLPPGSTPDGPEV